MRRELTGYAGYYLDLKIKYSNKIFYLCQINLLLLSNIMNLQTSKGKCLTKSKVNYQ